MEAASFHQLNGMIATLARIKLNSTRQVPTFPHKLVIIEPKCIQSRDPFHIIKRQTNSATKISREGAYFFGGDGDLVGLLLRLLADEPHHLLDLLRHVAVVHLRSDLRSPARVRRLPRVRTSPEQRNGWNDWSLDGD